MAGLARYQIARKKYFVSLNAMNLGIGSDYIGNVFWRAISLPLPSCIQNMVFQCGTIISRQILLVILLIALLM